VICVFSCLVMLLCFGVAWVVYIIRSYCVLHYFFWRVSHVIALSGQVLLENTYTLQTHQESNRFGRWVVSGGKLNQSNWASLRANRGWR